MREPEPSFRWLESVARGLPNAEQTVNALPPSPAVCRALMSLSERSGTPPQPLDTEDDYWPDFEDLPEFGGSASLELGLGAAHPAYEQPDNEVYKI